jgi:signal transduction histidine kinase
VKRELALEDGRRIPCEVAWRGLPDGRLLILARDLRAEQDAESLRHALVVHERLAALGTLAASVGHEINNPLTYLLANLRTSVDIIRGAALPQATRTELDELLDDAVDGAERVRRIVADLNVFARPTSAEAAVGPLDLQDVIARAVSLARPALSERCRVEVVDMGPVQVLGDERRLAQIVINLLTNASQAMPAGRARADNVVTLRVRRDGEAVVLEVADNGVGMSDDVRARIFEPFFTTRVGHGSGLGLSISRELAVSIGGDIGVSSSPGQGAVFSVKLRPAPAPTTAPREPAPAPPTRSPSAATATVLVIDDEARVAQAIARELQPRFTAVTATTVADGLARVTAGGVDCVLVDLSMPDGGARALLAGLPAGMRERVVVITGGAQSEEMSAFLDSAARPVLQKPIERERLLASVAAVVDGG